MIPYLPQDYMQALLLGRLETFQGPTPVLVQDGEVYDISSYAPTTADFLRIWTGDEAWKKTATSLGQIEDLGLTPSWERDGDNAVPRLLSPVDLQVVKASGVTFAVSAIERVIEERARGDAGKAAEFRDRLAERMGGDIRSVEPGSEPAMRLKDALIEDGVWSQYLEVAIGPDAEVFTKAPLLSSVGWGEPIGVRSDSDWNNPEPEVVLICDPDGQVRGASLGNDVNLRDIEGRSALLLGKAKDNNAAAAIGPFIRLFDDRFGMDDVRQMRVDLEVKGEDGFELSGSSSMTEISRDPANLVQQTCNASHQYPDGFALYLGTMFAPTKDRNAVGGGFTHHMGDRVRISAPALGVLENVVTRCDQATPWTFGVSALMRNLAQRGLLSA